MLLTDLTEFQNWNFSFARWFWKFICFCRIFRQPQGHLLLIGVSGAGKTTLSRFVAWMNGLSVYQIKVGKMHIKIFGTMLDHFPVYLFNLGVYVPTGTQEIHWRGLWWGSSYSSASVRLQEREDCIHYGWVKRAGFWFSWENEHTAGQWRGSFLPLWCIIKHQFQLWLSVLTGSQYVTCTM